MIGIVGGVAICGLPGACARVVGWEDIFGWEVRSGWVGRGGRQVWLLLRSRGRRRFGGGGFERMI